MKVPRRTSNRMQMNSLLYIDEILITLKLRNGVMPAVPNGWNLITRTIYIRNSDDGIVETIQILP